MLWVPMGAASGIARCAVPSCTRDLGTNAAGRNTSPSVLQGEPRPLSPIWCSPSASWKTSAVSPRVASNVRNNVAGGSIPIRSCVASRPGQDGSQFVTQPVHPHQRV